MASDDVIAGVVGGFLGILAKEVGAPLLAEVVKPLVSHFGADAVKGQVDYFTMSLMTADERANAKFSALASELRPVTLEEEVTRLLQRYDEADLYAMLRSMLFMRQPPTARPPPLQREEPTDGPTEDTARESPKGKRRNR